MKKLPDYEFEATAWEDYELVQADGGCEAFLIKGSARRLYNIAYEPALVSALAKLGDGPFTSSEHMPAYHHFLRTFGILLGPRVAPPALRISGVPCSPHHQPVVALTFHAMLVRLLMTMSYQEQTGELRCEDKLLRCTAFYSAPQFNIFPSTFEKEQKPPEPIKVDMLKQFGVPNVEIATFIRDQFFTQALAGVNRACQNGRDVFIFNSLIQLVYWRLRDDSMAYKVRRCKTCNHLFFAMDGRQLYCPPLPTMKESPCGAKKRQTPMLPGTKKNLDSYDYTDQAWKSFAGLGYAGGEDFSTRSSR